MNSTLSQLEEDYPGRKKQILMLYECLAQKHDPPVSTIFVYGGASVGKSCVISSFLKKFKIKHAFVNLIECYSSKILFETILNKLSGHKIDPTNGQPYVKSLDMMEFIDNLQKLDSLNDLTGAVIVLDKAEKLKTMDFNLLQGFLRLNELSGISITVILLTEIILEKFYSKGYLKEPLKIYFPQYNQHELLKILVEDIDNSRILVMSTYETSFEFDVEFYKNYLNVFLSVFYRACRDLSELRHMARVNFLKYCEPIINKEHSVNDSLALWRHIAPILKSSLEVLYLRVSTDQSHTNCEQIQKQFTFSKENLSVSLQLPFYAKYLLIAAYLASYNPAKDDKRIFMKYHGKKNKTKKDIKAKSKVSELLNTQLGPKPFTFERLLAIFYAILDDKVGFNNNLLVQISSLVELQLLSTMTQISSLDGHKYKCNVGFDFIQALSKIVGFNIRKYLSDFSHV